MALQTNDVRSWSFMLKDMPHSSLIRRIQVSGNTLYQQRCAEDRLNTADPDEIALPDGIGQS